MSSPFAANFLKLWRRLAPSDAADRITLAKIELSVPSSRTLRYATTEIHTPDGNTWQAGLEASSVRAAIEWLGSGLAPVDTSIRLAKRRDASQSSGTLHDLLSDFVWQNAIVTLYLWTPAEASFSNAPQVFKGRISRPAEISPSGMTLHLLQDQSWNVQTPPKVVDKTSYPDSPDVSQGMPIPIVYGDHRAPAMRSPWTTAYGAKSYQEDAGAGLGVVPMILVDAGVGASSVKLVAAGHECADILSRTTGYSQFLLGDALLHPLDVSGITENLGSSESYLSIADEKAIAYAAIIPIDVRSAAGGNTAGNPRRAMDPFDETSFAELNQSTGKSELQLILPNAPLLGRIESVDVDIAYKGDASNTHNLRVNTYTPGVGPGGSPMTWLATITTPALATFTWPTSYYTQDWDFGGSSTILDIRVDFAGGTTNKASIYWVVLVVKYRPQRSLVTPGARVLSGTQPVHVMNRRPGDPRNRYPIYSEIFPTYRLEGQFYGNIKGYKDDVSGTFTGTASALIERPPDIMRHFLATYGLVSGSDIETAADATGSFVDARATLRNAQPSDLKLACWIGERTTIQRVLQTMAEQSGMCLYMDRFTNKWLAFVWKPGAVVDYDYKLSWYELASISTEETSVVNVRHAIRVKYGLDHFKSKTLYEAFVNASGSGQGTNFPTQRDQRLVVTANVNDDLDWKTGAWGGGPFTYADVLAAGTYAPIDLASEIQSKLRTHVTAYYMYAGHGFTIKAAYNNALEFGYGASAYQTTVPAAEYTAEGLAAAVATAMNAAASLIGVITCTYSHSTNKFTIASSGSNISLTGPTTAVSPGTLTMFALGWKAGTAAAASITAPHARYGDRFWALSEPTATFQFLFGTGASAGTSCAALLGFPVADTAVANDQVATYSRGDRERISSTLEGYYGPKEERQITADWIRDELTAVELRNRLFDLVAKPRVVVKLSSHRIPDIRPMQVIELDADIDPYVAFPRYGSDGSWAGKRLRVLEVEQHLGPDYSTEILAMEA